MFSLFLLALSPEIYFPVIRNLCLVLKLCFIHMETSSDSLSHFLSPLPPLEHRQELCFKRVLISWLLLRNAPSIPRPSHVKTSGSSRPRLQKQWKYGQSYNYTAYIDIYMLCIHFCVCVTDISLLCKVTTLQTWQKMIFYEQD